MSRRLKRLAAVAAVGTAGALAPVASAGAATPYNFPVPSYTGISLPQFSMPSMPALPAFTPGSLSFVGPSVGGLAAVIGPTVITVGAGNIFTGTTITTTGGGAIVGTGPGG
jgi:hypothetical protein